MTMPSRRIFVASAVAAGLFGLVALGGCGWAPLYADRAAGPADQELAAIKVAPIPERIGQVLALDLRQWLNPNGDPVPSRYLLRTLLQTTRFDLGILSIGVGTRARFDAVANFTLFDIATSTPLFAATTHTGESFDILSNYYADVVAEEAVRERAAKEISRDIVAQLTAFLQRRAAPAAPAP
ncbi:MAG: LPS assembly lipoprotein LptE [Alphaproteobacteria bacterium]